MRSYESISHTDRKVNQQCKVKSVHFWHTIKLYFRYRFTQRERTTVEPPFKGARGFFLKKPHILRVSLKPNLKHRSTSILRKE